MSFLDKLVDAGMEIWESTDPNKKATGGLNSFISKVKKDGLARNSKFVVLTVPPLCLYDPTRKEQIGDENYTELLAMYCRSAQLPGINFITSTLTINGSHIDVPVEKHYDKVTLSFYVDAGMMTKVFFDNWMDAIQLYSTKGFEYYSRYTTTILIDILNEEEQHVYSVELQEAYPISINSNQLDYAMPGLMELQVTFSYKSWKSTKFVVQPEKLKSFLDKLFEDQPWYSGTVSTIGTILNTTDEYVGRFERLRGIGRGVINQAKGIPGIFGSKVSRIKDLGKWL